MKFNVGDQVRHINDDDVFFERGEVMGFNEDTAFDIVVRWERSGVIPYGHDFLLLLTDESN